MSILKLSLGGNTVAIQIYEMTLFSLFIHIYLANKWCFSFSRMTSNILRILLWDGSLIYHIYSTIRRVFLSLE